jgi:hypothetical protein
MKTCNYCGTTILFGGKKSDGLCFCNDRCQQAGMLLAVSSQFPEDLVQQRTLEVHAGTCPRCQSGGPVDVYTSYRVWSALLLTSWSNRPHITCRSCGLKSQLADTAFSLVFGWWGVPWGFVLTPVQVCRNVAAMLRSDESTKPSAQLEKFVRMDLAKRILASQQPRGSEGSQ